METEEGRRQRLEREAAEAGDQSLDVKIDRAKRLYMGAVARMAALAEMHATQDYKSAAEYARSMVLQAQVIAGRLTDVQTLLQKKFERDNAQWMP